MKMLFERGVMECYFAGGMSAKDVVRILRARKYGGSKWKVSDFSDAVEGVETTNEKWDALFEEVKKNG